MPEPPIDARSMSGRALSVTPCGDDGVILRITTDEPVAPLRAARFFMLRREDKLSPAIPRPFSVYRQTGRELEFLIKVMGRGTAALAACTQDTPLRVIGPLGNGWPTLDGGRDGGGAGRGKGAGAAPWVMLAGGIGSAPFYMGIEQALRGMDGQQPVRKDEITYLYGAARRGLLYDLAAFEALGVRVATCTDDGSHGLRGNVLQLLEHLQAKGEVPRQVRLLACGPERMLEAVEHFAREKQLVCWLSLETLMGCGVGICNGCPVPTRPDGPLGAWPNAKCCVEGPVFSVDAVAL
jgi:dihydroorotate dehydrogenase electron transfer subunit